MVTASDLPAARLSDGQGRQGVLQKSRISKYGGCLVSTQYPRILTPLSGGSTENAIIKLYHLPMKSIVRVIIIILLVAASVTLAKSIHSQLSRFNEIYKAEAQMRQFTEQNRQLEERLAKEKSNFALEQSARDKLGYQNPGEVLYVLPDQKYNQVEKQKKSKENWRAWYELVLR